MTQEKQTQELDIPEFLKGQTKEYVRIEKNEYRLMMQNLDQARRMAYTDGIATGMMIMAIIGVLIAAIVIGVHHFSFGTLPIAGP